MTQTTQTTQTATTMEQKIAKQNAKYLEMLKQANLTQDGELTRHGYLNQVDVVEELTAKNGTKGAHFVFHMAQMNPEGSAKKYTYLSYHAWAYGAMANYYQKIADTVASHDTVTATVVRGKNKKGFDAMATIFVEKVYDKSANDKAQADQTVDLSDDELPF